jgi:hypothetical protein
LHSDKPPLLPSGLTENRFDVTELLQEISNPDTHLFIKTLDILLIVFGLLSMILGLWINVAQLIKYFKRDKRLPILEDEDCEMGEEKMEIEEDVVADTDESEKAPLLLDV